MWIPSGWSRRSSPRWRWRVGCHRSRDADGCTWRGTCISGSTIVRIRLAADGMADLVAHLPAEQAAACLGALQRSVNEHYATAESVIRSRGQILADTLVERITG